MRFAKKDFSSDRFFLASVIFTAALTNACSGTAASDYFASNPAADASAPETSTDGGYDATPKDAPPDATPTATAWTTQFGDKFTDNILSVAVDSNGATLAGGSTYDFGTNSFSGILQKFAASGALEWTSSVNTASGDAIVAVATDASSHVYVTGYVGAALSGQTSSGSYDAFVRKLDGSGNVLWTRQFGTSGTDVGMGLAIDPAGNVFVAGYVSGALPGQTTAGDIDGYVRKLDGSGATLWTHQFGTSASDMARGVAVDSNGIVMVVGETSGAFSGFQNKGSADVFVRILSASGKETVTKQFGSNYADRAQGVAWNGSFFVAGQYATGSSSSFVAKYDASGSTLALSSFGAALKDTATSLALSKEGDVLIVGQVQQTVPGGTSAGGADVFITKFDSALSWSSSKQFGTSLDDTAYGVAVRSDGSIVVGGQTEGAFAGKTNGGGADGFVRSFDVSGN